jgi:phosphatidate phosphatase APP1
MLRIYHDLPFILIGDSGQKDPEIYAKIVTEHPGRVLAVYIRDIESDPERRSALEKLGSRINDAGSRLLVAEDSFAMAKHAANHGFISDKALSGVMEDRILSEHPGPHGRIRKQVEA